MQTAASISHQRTTNELCLLAQNPTILVGMAATPKVEIFQFAFKRERLKCMR